MSITTRLALLAGIALLGLGGCRQADRATSVPPTRAELPRFEELEPTLPIVVGIEGAGSAARVVIVPQYEPIEPTPEELRVLGWQEQPEPDVLAFWRPRRGPEQGVSADSFGLLTGIGGVGGPTVGRCQVYPRYGRHGLAGRYAYPQRFGRRGAGVGPPRSRSAQVGRSWTLEVGETLPRRGAQRASRSGR